MRHSIYLKKKLQMLKKEQHDEDVNLFVDFMVEEVLKRARLGITTFVCTDITYIRYLENYKLQSGNQVFVSFSELEHGFRERFPDSKVEVNRYMFTNDKGEQETRYELVVNWS